MDRLVPTPMAVIGKAPILETVMMAKFPDKIPRVVPGSKSPRKDSIVARAGVEAQQALIASTPRPFAVQIPPLLTRLTNVPSAASFLTDRLRSVRLPPVHGDAVPYIPESARSKTYRRRALPALPLEDDDEDDHGIKVPLAPLEWFDDTWTFETRSPQQWLQLGIDAGLRGTPARSQYHSLGDKYVEWTACYVLDYSASDNKFLVEWLHNQKQKWVARLNLVFDSESETRFSERVQAARDLRAVIKHEARYHKYLNELSKRDVLPMDEEQRSRVLTKIQMETSWDYVGEDINDGHMLGVKKAMIEYGARTDAEKRLRLESLNLPLPPDPLPAPEFGYVVPPVQNFTETVATLEAALIRYQSPYDQVLLQTWLRVIQNISQFKLVELRESVLDVPCALEHFVELQESHLESVMRILRNDWTPVVADLLNKATQVIHRSQDEYEGTPMQNFVKLLELMMGSRLWQIVLDTLQDVLQFFERYTLSNVAIVDSVLITLNELTPSQYVDRLPSDVPPLFRMKMFVQNGQFVFEPTAADIEAAVMEHCVNQCVQSVASLERVDGLLFTWVVSPHNTFRLPAIDCADVRRVRERLHEIFQDNIGSLRQLVAVYEEFLYLVDMQPEAFVEEFLSSKPDLRDYESAVRRLQHDINRISTASFDVVGCDLFQVDVQQPKRFLMEKARTAAKLLLAKVMDQARASYVNIDAQCNEMAEKVCIRPTNVEALVATRQYADEVESRTLLLRTEVSEVQLSLDMVLQYRFDVDEEDVALAWRAFHGPNRLPPIITQARHQLEEDTVGIEAELRQNQKQFLQHVRELATRVEQLEYYTNIELVDQYAADVRNMQKELDDTQETAALLNSREQLLHWATTASSGLTTVIQLFTPYFQMWTTASNFLTKRKAWMDGSFVLLDSGGIEQEVLEWYRVTQRLTRTFKDSEGPGNIAQTIRKDIEEFKAHLPIIQALRTPGLRPSHWDQISDIVGQTIRPTRELKLRGLLRMNIGNYMEKIREVADVAAQEYALEQGLKKMQDEWGVCKFDIMDFRESGTHILRGPDDILSMLDDQITKTQTMKCSPHVAPLMEKLTKWEQSLLRMQESVDQWIKVQGMYIYLQPIFGSEDIMTQMPNEGTMFKGVDKMWRLLMKTTVADPSVLRSCEARNLKPTLAKANAELEHILSKVNDYLELKRRSFPRFYFLSNDELLEILYETKDPLRVQPHLHKCFEGIHSLYFEEDKRITGMMSAQGEHVKLVTEIQPLDYGSDVEKWLLQLEKTMQATLQQIMSNALKAFNPQNRTKWVAQWPGQAVLGLNSVLWTRQVVQALQKGSRDELESLEKVLEKQLTEIVGLVRADVNKVLRLTLEAMIVSDVHSKNVVQEMFQQNVDNTNSFGWTSQLRYYMEDDRVHVRMMTASLEYQYEYLGNAPRLVITPLTMRVYRTLMTALQLHFGGAPEGPAGTGKTETVKDLAKAVAVQCIVFNCSEGLDYMAMGKFFKGLAISGAWACFDEFNRLQLEVLSVIAQQILVIQRAIGDGGKSFLFEGATLPLNNNCAVFITMNPGYAGRAELPDNLKALFRPVAMMVPNYNMIALISLYSYGFLNANKLADKIIMTYKLCSQQLSAQDHYDYGMRAVKAVLLAAGGLKRTNPAADEFALVLRAIIEVNMPKFLPEDVELFKGILSDLFPGQDNPMPEYPELKGAIRQAFTAIGLQCISSQLDKAIQLFESVRVRHGVIMVGRSYSGKTSTCKTLASALSELNKSGNEEFRTTKLHYIAPKAITRGHLYGLFDSVSHDWKDGVLATVFRACSVDPTNDANWIIFDGPVDAVWIEDMNSVLDDNKKLCLTSGEIIQMTSKMTLLFEVSDLAQASPATVSRCGMVYMDPMALGWKPLFDSWLANLPSLLGEAQRQLLADLFNWFVPAGLVFYHQHVTTGLLLSDQHMVHNLMNLMDSLMDDFRDPEVSTKYSAAKISTWLECLFMFALVWTVGNPGSLDDRQLFDGFMRELNVRGKLPIDIVESLQREGISIPVEMPFKLSTFFPENGLVHEYTFNKQHLRWDRWIERDADYEIPPTMSFTDIIVPTLDTKRFSFLLSSLITHNKSILIVGPSGTGKTLYVNDLINNKLVPANTHTSISLNFSARTTAHLTQTAMESKLKKRVKGGAILGPPDSMKCIVFVDDVNMPEPETYGAQPPIELLRQCISHGGWYDRKNAAMFKQIQDTFFVTAMTQHHLQRPSMTHRFLRHFNVIHVTEFDHEGLTMTLRSLMRWYLHNFSDEVRSLSEPLVHATIEIFKAMKKELRPTPSKLHYIFTMRDLARVQQGMLLATPDCVKTKPEIVRLWCHEILRVFHDRLVTDADRGWCKQMTKRMTEEHFGVDFTATFSHLDLDGNGDIDEEELRHLIFTDFGDRDTQAYREVMDLSDIVPQVESYLQEYNLSSNKPMRLVLFLFAVEHVARIARILRQPLGNALLVGVGGSGRQSLTRLACFVTEYDLHQIEISKAYGYDQWREDIKRLLRRTGIDGKPTVFLLSDTQIKDETYLEDINNLLNTGEVPNLYSPEEMSGIIESVRSQARYARRDRTSQQIFGFFVERCRLNIHIVLCMSPIGDAFRNRLLMFPSLINCCTIDVFSDWPEEALEGLASNFLAEAQLPEEHRQPIVELCMSMHQSVIALSEQFRNEERRYNYVTPSSYLDLIALYLKLLQDKQIELANMKGRYERGLEKLQSSQVKVSEMKEELAALQPKLERTNARTEILLMTIEKETADAEQTKRLLQQEEEEVSVVVQRNQTLKDECEAELAKSMPALKRATQALNELDKNDISEVKSMKKPPQGVKLVMEAVCVMTGVEPVKKSEKSATGLTVKLDYWEAAQKFLLNDPKFLQNLLTFDKDSITEDTVERIKTYITDPLFNPDQIARASKAAKGLSVWVRAVDFYHRIQTAVAPKKAALLQAETDLQGTMAILTEKRGQVAALEAKIADLQTQFNKNMEVKNDLEKRMNDCSVKLERARTLIEMFGDEQVRWSKAVGTITHDLQQLLGDALIAAGIIAYLGAFTSGYRDQITRQWIANCGAHNIPCSPDFRLTNIQDPLKIRQWVNQERLPGDPFSIENAIIMSKTRRWPLVIDPQDQCNQWIRSKERDNRLILLKMSAEDFLPALENAIQFGYPVLLEGVPEELDPTLEPILLKQVFKYQGASCIRIGDHNVPYDDRFRFYITSKLANPHFLPQLTTKVTLINFTITKEGLQEQMLGLVLAHERSELEAEKQMLIVQNDENRKSLKEIEERILQVLDECSNILEDERAIEVVKQSKTLSNDIQKKQEIAMQNENEIDVARARYLPVAVRGSNLFFCVSSLVTISPMYAFSLGWFTQLFNSSMDVARNDANIEQRLQNLNNTFTLFLYTQVCRSLFEKDQLLFSLLLCVSSQIGTPQQLPDEQIRFLITGGSSREDSKVGPNPFSKWLPDTCWRAAHRLAQVPTFEGFVTSLRRNEREWRQWWEHAEPQVAQPPCAYEGIGDTKFGKLLVLRVMRRDRLFVGTQQFISKMMGEKFAFPPPVDIAQTYRDATPKTPIILLLSPGADPTEGILAFAQALGFGKKLTSISLGQGQYDAATLAIKRAEKLGLWVVLQNVHLASSWTDSFESLYEEIVLSEETHKDFRLWLTSYPSSTFPVSILRNGVKMTTEPPKGLRANMLRSYRTYPISNEKFYAEAKNPREFHRLLFGLCFFHAAVQERRKYGPLGWNVQYEFSYSDLVTSVKQLKMLLNRDTGPFSWQSLLYLVGECNYGGRVTDDWDRRTLTTMLSELMNDATIFGADGRSMVPDVPVPSGEKPTFTLPSDDSYRVQIAHVEAYPLVASPEVFGLHANAEITRDIDDTEALLANLLAAQSSERLGADERAAVVNDMASSLLATLPATFDMESARVKFPMDYHQSLNVALIAELRKFNILLKLIRSSLEAVKRAANGLDVSTKVTEEVTASVYNNRIPQSWAKASFLTRKSLSLYMSDLSARCAFFRSWVHDKAPVTYMLSAFFFPHSFLMALCQNFARKYSVPIDTVSFTFSVMDDEAQTAKAPPCAD
eukprot:TRINITY_DN5834_c0_g2_i1.p1 TRINITY_DN5834_c0_g2~~TRINITY_DN5834_c0_g2_i1.p1  ORF type:complete len:4046 (-),score=1123.04 TRINITY_DN5834_c0_g2_i1:354-12491(-)